LKSAKRRDEGGLPESTEFGLRQVCGATLICQKSCGFEEEYFPLSPTFSLDAGCNISPPLWFTPT
jgi:hypothetical protein